MFGRERIEYKSPDQVRVMRRAGLVVADALAAVREHVRPGVTTADLDAVAAKVIADAGATPSFLGYHGYPATLCVSVNDEVVHGIPGSRVLEPGDVVSVDCGAVVDGWHGDSAVTIVLEGADPADLDLAATTEQAMWAGIAALATAERLGAVGEAVEDVVDAAAAEGRNGGQRYGVVEEYVGHGIGTAMHQPPDVLNYRTRDRGPRVRPGLCVAIEPMVVRGQRFTQVLDDDWTVVTVDGSRASHWEHTVAVGEGGLWVLTARDGGAAALAALGVEVAPLD
ncbi:type I methionyl aminopeptidase [Cellulomonas fimi]|uniref:Methionine aminopeptidase n=1 Tax=Cellulomonas fimi (strain ATCC 484 / DSM 20113 / JCM 1341 / CCUG 24087 / LMG 16345 / NBRC 15513 / NCIMB 8980 / NCTC 7547 / NRS-133) TaxID=590998 RepID=F4H1Z0_CELFA|nr:type I methionyl aminopeptidase [Cellulomonas fimi]AEE45160.1 methionine aminopeptidase, type I [Cellulomonas fimi ATCC 484]NNH06277.1 type I methionyl aminopeptidase [Cellulomonas fimi]VEH28420.1 Methionine aminopeptidase 1 [Cellulomonas fimi]